MQQVQSQGQDCTHQLWRFIFTNILSTRLSSPRFVREKERTRSCFPLHEINWSNYLLLQWKRGFSHSFCLVFLNKNAWISDLSGVVAISLNKYKSDIIGKLWIFVTDDYIRSILLCTNFSNILICCKVFYCILLQ